MLNRISLNQRQEAELERIQKKHGAIDEKIVVRESRAKRSPLHSLFFWDDDKRAAAIGRHEIARMILVSVRVKESEAEELRCTVGIRKYHGGLGGGYFTISNIMQDPSLQMALLAQALADLDALQKRYEMIASLLEPIRRATKRVKDSVTRAGHQTGVGKGRPTRRSTKRVKASAARKKKGKKK